MAIIRLPGRGRYFLNTDTGEKITRRQADKLLGRVVGSNEQKAKKNKKEDLIKSLARPARGRKKINPVKDFEEVESRVFTDRLKRVRTKKISKSLLKAGHKAERVNFFTYDQYLEYMKSMKGLKAPDGLPLITAVGLGITGHSIRTDSFGKQYAATVLAMQSPRNILSRDEFEETINDWLDEHDYVVIEYYWLHLHFNRQYAEDKLEKSQKRKLRKLGIR